VNSVSNYKDSAGRLWIYGQGYERLYTSLPQRKKNHYLFDYEAYRGDIAGK